MTDTTSVTISKNELWLIRLVGGAILAFLGWIGIQAQGAVIQLAEIKRELEITKPADVLAAVRELESATLTNKEVLAIIEEEAPWNEVKREWMIWRAETDTKFRALADKSADRWTKTDHELFISELRRLNPDLKIPE